MTTKRFSSLVHFLFICLILTPGLSGETRGVENGQRYDRLVIRNVVAIDGKGTPARGPVDVVLSGNSIESVTSAKGADAYREEDHVLDGTGMHILPGFIDLHGHVGHIDGDFEYTHKIWLMCGVTSVRDVGSDYTKTFDERRKSQEGLIAAPRIFIYMTARGGTPEEVRQRVREIKEKGADGVKIFSMERDILKACLEEANKLGLRVAHHVAVEETDVWDDIAFGTTTIEHWYGIPDAALHGSQNFPHFYNYSNEYHRFNYGGRLWREADPVKLEKVLQAMVEKNVGWVPTFTVYEANRDLVRAMNKPWFKDYRHPVVEEKHKPKWGTHGSYHWTWTTTDEVFWRENYKIWMKAVRDFANMGGIVGTGDDAGPIITLKGFAFIRELELHQEAGFHPIDVIQNATGNGAKLLGMEGKLGRIRQGYLADLLIVDGNPLYNLKCLYPAGSLGVYGDDGELVTEGGIQWVIKDGFVHHGPTLWEDVKRVVREARKKKGT